MYPISNQAQGNVRIKGGVHLTLRKSIIGCAKGQGITLNGSGALSKPA